MQYPYNYYPLSCGTEWRLFNMKKMQCINLAFVATIALANLSGCSGTSAHAIRPEGSTDKSLGKADEDSKGFRYYESSPYLLVYANGKGGLETKLIYLPDPNKKRSIKPWEFLSSNTANLTFSNGVLTESKLAGDSTVIGKAIVEGFKAILEVAAGAAGGAALLTKKPAQGTDPYKVPFPSLYKIVVTKNGTQLYGGEGFFAELDNNNLPVKIPGESLHAIPGLIPPASGDKQ